MARFLEKLIPQLSKAVATEEIPSAQQPAAQHGLAQAHHGILVTLAQRVVRIAVGSGSSASRSRSESSSSRSSSSSLVAQDGLAEQVQRQPPDHQPQLGRQVARPFQLAASVRDRDP